MAHQNIFDLKKDKIAIIHLVLAFGTIKELRLLFRRYSKQLITRVFLRYPIKIYSRQDFLFAKNFILSLLDADVPEKKYVDFVIKRFPGTFGPPPIAMPIS